MKIVINSGEDGLTEAQVQEIQAVSEENEVVVARNREEHLAQAPDADVILGSFNRDLFERAKKLKWVQTFGAGVDGILFEEFVQSPLLLTSAKGTVGTHLA